jgi:hypothetical protein
MQIHNLDTRCYVPPGCHAALQLTCERDCPQRHVLVLAPIIIIVIIGIIARACASAGNCFSRRCDAGGRMF